MTRPFTVTVNAAFESCGKINPIAAEHLERSELGDTVKTVIKPIDELLAVAHSNGKLFSEVGSPWATASKPFKVDNYTKFPSTDFVL
jgi:hypothetical protein